MIQLNSKPLTPSTIAHLATVQNRIDTEPDFPKKVGRAKTEWTGKIGSTPKKAAFTDIKETLIEMCVGVEVCNYCENNEATDVEHIYPKSLFPERAFRWNNYLLACKTCNTHYKLDQFAVFDAAGSAASVEVARNTQPPTDDGTLIDPRTEDPLQYFWLDIENKTFVLDPRLKLSSRDYERARYTLKLLGLNDRDALVTARKTAAKYYLDRLKRYVSARDANSFDSLEEQVQDPDLIDETLLLEQEKQRICQQIKSDIETHAHPTVWAELKRQRSKLPKTNRLFEQAPEALNW